MMMYERVVEMIKSYTGLSPTSFLLILTNFIVTYNFVSSFFVHVDVEDSNSKSEPALQVDVKDSNSKSEPDSDSKSQQREAVVQVGCITPDQLKSYDGSDPNKPLLMAIKGQIYDVSVSSMFYGPGGRYSLFAGRDATCALALMSFDPQDLTSNTQGLSQADLDVLHDWELKFSEKYPKLGTLLDTDPDQPQDLESKKFV